MRITSLGRKVLTLIAGSPSGLTVDELCRTLPKVARERMWGIAVQLQADHLIGIVPGFKLEVTGLGRDVASR